MENDVALRQPVPHRSIMGAINAFITRFPVLTFYALTFSLSWSAFLIIGGPGLFASTDWQSDPRFLPAVMAMLTGPTIASLVLTGLISGRRGLRDIRSRLLRWRVGARWYAIALLTTPILFGAVLLGLSLTSPAYLPAIVTADDRAGLVLSGVALSCTTILEEVGWTGFATPRLRLRHRALSTGLIAGILWGVWHLLQIVWVARTSSAGLSMTVYLPLYFLSGTGALTAYRVLMVHVYDHTGSLPVATLMHASYAACTIVILSPGVMGASFLIYSWVFTAVLWGVVAVVTVANGRHSRSPLRHRRDPSKRSRPSPVRLYGR